MNHVQIKISATALRIWHALAFLPVRLQRFGLHFLHGLGLPIDKKKVELPGSRYAQWWVELTFLLLDLLAVPEVYETLADWIKWSTRPLSDDEVKLARTIFGDSLEYRRIRVDEKAQIACRDMKILYVSYFTINSWGSFRPDIFIHELVHVWQYQKFGAVYIPRALLAQRTQDGYNYGGVVCLEENMSVGGSLDDFNLEQQADIVGDGFCLKNGLSPRWTRNELRDLPVFEYYLRELKM